MIRFESSEEGFGGLARRALGANLGREVRAEPTVRAFVALPLPSALRRSVGEIARRLSEQPASRSSNARFIGDDALHVTLKFLGRVESSRLPAIREALSVAARLQPRLRLELKGAGCFPDAARPRVLWLGLEGDLPALASLAAEVEKQLLPLGFPPEDHAFSPHLTLCRLASPTGASDLAAALFALAGEIHGELPAEELVLFRSDTLPTGARHSPIYRIPFGGGRLLA